MITISITNRQKNTPVDRRRMRLAVRAILDDADIADARVSVAVVDDPTIAALHEEFLNDPTPTDVLSFVLERSAGLLEGEVVASADTARRCAARYGNTPERELLLYVIHGALHLVGYDDATPQQRAVMRRKEKKYLHERSASEKQCPPKKLRPS
ncbi:MAG: rRNA maturation RNase YbeY [Planctomycetaceae bacterium]|nr:rRNA maturation RNase YbeY [Planctomycetaceae bacterium]